MDCVDCDSHHNMFQNGYGHPAPPPLGIPDAAFREFHQPILQHLRALASDPSERTT